LLVRLWFAELALGIFVGCRPFAVQGKQGRPATAFWAGRLYLGKPIFRAEIAVVTDDFPGEKDIFHFRAVADVVYDQVALARSGQAIDYDADVRHIST